MSAGANCPRGSGSQEGQDGKYPAVAAGLFFPLSFALVSAALVKLGYRWQGALVLVAMIAWPVGHIGDIAAVTVPVNVALVLAFGSLAGSDRRGW